MFCTLAAQGSQVWIPGRDLHHSPSQAVAASHIRKMEEVWHRCSLRVTLPQAKRRRLATGVSLGPIFLTKKKKEIREDRFKKKTIRSSIPHCHRTSRIAFHSTIQVLVHVRYTSVAAKLWLGRTSIPLEFPSASLQINI